MQRCGSFMSKYVGSVRVFQKRVLANSLPLFFQRGQLSTFIHSLRGQMSTPLYELGGKCPHMQFLGRGKCPRGQMSGSRSKNLSLGYSLASLGASVPRVQFGITRLRVMPNCTRGTDFRSVPHTHDRFFFLHTYGRQHMNKKSKLP